MYDSYIRAIRWASDRIGDSGVIGFITNAGFIENTSGDGIRKCLHEEFSSIYIFHLRGNQRTQGEDSRREGGKIFGSGSRAPIAISFLIKNPNATESGKIYFYDIGDYLNREMKLNIISDFSSIKSISNQKLWNEIIPDEHGDWLNQRDNSFYDFIIMGKKKGDETSLFENFSLGVVTSRDTWCYNYSQEFLLHNMKKTINFYNSEIDRIQNEHPKLQTLSSKERLKIVNDNIDTDNTKISWSRALKQNVAQQKKHKIDESNIYRCLYRPFTKSYCYFDRSFNEMIYQLEKLFPTPDAKNIVILINSNYKGSGNIAFISDSLVDYHTNGDTQCFPLYLYDRTVSKSENLSLFEENQNHNITKKDAISDEGFNHFMRMYPELNISKEDIFYYVYGILHSPDYLEKYSDNLSKELPRIPCVSNSDDFVLFSKAGRNLASLHLSYDSVEPYPVKIESKENTEIFKSTYYRVEKMKYKSKDDKSILNYNSRIALKEIPLEAYEYIVNGKSALDWIVERQCVKKDKKSGIENDANHWAIESMGNPAYPLELFQKVISVSLETMKIVNSLPPLEIE